MSEFRAVATLAEFMRLDEGEVLEGYFDGFHDALPPAATRSTAYWHGWRNGQVDNGNRPADAAQQALARDFELLGLHGGFDSNRFPMPAN